MSVMLFKIMRQRKQYDGTTRWVEIGTCVVNQDQAMTAAKDEGFCGTVYLNHHDEIWKLADPRTKERSR